MRSLRFVILLFILGCGAKQNPNPCQENLEFKEEFFKQISIVENITYGKERQGNLRESLKFISHYAPVSYGKLQNYTFGYNLESFEADKAGWLKWYEENKCNNIQF